MLKSVPKIGRWKEKKRDEQTVIGQHSCAHYTLGSLRSTGVARMHFSQGRKRTLSEPCDFRIAKHDCCPSTLLRVYCAKSRVQGGGFLSASTQPGQARLKQVIIERTWFWRDSCNLGRMAEIEFRWTTVWRFYGYRRCALTMRISLAIWEFDDGGWNELRVRRDNRVPERLGNLKNFLLEFLLYLEAVLIISFSWKIY